MFHDPYHIPGLDRWLTEEPEHPEAAAYEHFVEEADLMGFDELLAEFGEERENALDKYGDEESAVRAMREEWVEMKLDDYRNPEPPDDYYDRYYADDHWED